MASRVCVIGLDCAAPELVFERWRELLPNLSKLMANGVYGPLELTKPPITVPAWMCMMTGKDPGELGVYGFRNRRDHSYDGLAFANGRMIAEPAVWDALAAHGRRTIALGVPLTYPPRPINGLMITDFLAPDTNANYTYPPELKDEIKAAVGDYILDTRDFRTDDKARLLNDIYEMTAKRFQLARWLIATKPWDLFAMVEMGVDRIHHGFWKFFDSTHARHVPGNKFENAIRDYYIEVDREVGELIRLLDPDTRVLVVSDHGAKRMDGGICLNQWLIENGYLTLREPAVGVKKFDPGDVDWNRTRAWGDGGYYGRVFLNVEGREPNGVVAPIEVDALRDELSQRLTMLGDEQGRPIGTRVFRPDRIYKEARNVPPDLIVYFGDLHWRSVGSVGHASVWTRENDTGPDDANHAQFGIFIMSQASAIDAPAPAERTIRANRREGLSIYDVAPTILSAMNVSAPRGMGRRSIDAVNGAADVLAYSPEEEAELARRLEDLGYL